MFDPVGDSDDVDVTPIASRPDTLDNKRVGLLNNGKPAAEPTLSVIEDHLRATYPEATLKRYDVSHLNRLKSDDELAQIRSWADEEVDVCIGALGDCGSCTKLLVYGVNAVEDSGTPALGLIDEGFKIDWESNRRDFGRQLRYYPLDVIAEVTDKDRIRELIPERVFADVVDELTRSRTGDELADGDPGGHKSESIGRDHASVPPEE